MDRFDISRGVMPSNPACSVVALKVRSETYRILEVLTAMAALYCIMGYPQAKLADWVHRKLKVAE